MTHIIIGMGEIGSALYRVLSVQYNVITYDIGYSGLVSTTDDVTLHICFPYSASFVDDVKEYMEVFGAAYVIVYSTVAIGTCNKIGSDVVHSPIEGKHPDLEKSIRVMTRWVATSDIGVALYFVNLFDQLGIQSKHVKDSSHTEALKLLSTSEYGINIVFAELKAKVAKEIGMDFVLTKEWNEEYNKLYRLLGHDSYRKYVLDPPGDTIGGHCVVPNAEILRKQFPHVLLDIIIKKKKKEPK
jgi:UDP-N-acetyl-D-mannosaminuronate dehydrogenase